MTLNRILGLAFFIGLTVLAFTPDVLGIQVDRPTAKIAALDF